MRATRVGIWVAAAVMFVSAGSAHAARWMEYLNRGVVAVHVPGSGVYVGWRMLGTDPQTIGFNVYRDGVRRNASPITTSTNFMDSGGTTASTYYIRPVIGGVEQEASEIVTVWSQTHSTQPLRFLDVPIQVPAGGTTPDGVAYTYSANDLSVGDLDGDGQYEIIVKWDPSNSKDNSQVGHTGNVFIDAYKLDGTKLWRIDLGVNIRAGAHYTQFLVWDLDGDGRAEVALKTAPGTIDGVGHFVIMGNDDPHIDYRDANGFIITGPEYFTVFNGLTGAEMATIAYPMPRGDISDWGDTWGNRGDRFLAAVAFLDGERPSIVKCRGYYGPQAGRRGKNQITALDFRNGQLTQRWQFTATINTGNDVNPEFIGQGHHSLSVIDVNGDGFDEIIYGAAVINHDGTGRFSTGLGHGDALHVSDINPLRPGYEVFGIHEGTGSPGAAMYAAESGVILWQTANADSGRGVAADIDPAHPGMECWHAASPNLFTAAGGSASNSKPGSCNFVIWWDADLSREISDADRIDKWVPVSSSTTRLLSLFNYGVVTNNGTKKNPGLQADILGDWREEMIMRTSNSTALRIFTPVSVTNHRIHTLMHDSVYRMGIAWQNVGYNQPPHTSFFLGNGMTLPVPAPDIITIQFGQDVDVEPPQPNPMTWAILPHALNATTIRMTATTAADPSGVEYYFANITDPSHDSGWQDSPTFIDTGLVNNTAYSYRVIARDKSRNRNANQWSEIRAATTYSAGTTTTRYEAENQFFHSTVFENINAGFSGTGYANTDNIAGSYVEWTISVPAAVFGQIDIRFANGTTTNRAMSIMVNGSIIVESFDFPGTGAWTNWATRSATVNLLAGTNTIRLTSLVAGQGGPNLDYIDLIVPLIDLTTPTPDPMEWLIPPAATSYDTITMTARMAGDASGVEYYFANLTDPSHDSGWQDSPTFIDTGLLNNMSYTYIVVARDKSPQQNTTAASPQAMATTLRYICPVPLTSDLSSDCFINFYDFALFAEEYLAGGIGSPADFDSDNVVGFADMAVLIAEWLKCGREPATECP